MVWLLLGTLFLCGCTKKDELLVLSGGESLEEAGKSGELVEMAEDDAETASQTAAVSGQTEVQEPRQEEIRVHVCGAVERPGVYALQPGCRVYEAVEAAGGFAADAEKDYVNQAQALQDGVKLVIPTKEEAASVSERESKTEAEAQAGAGGSAQLGIVGGTQTEADVFPADGRININTASEAQLCNIPGIGATRAAAIIAYRESHGGFQTPEDIMKVSGIKEGMYEKIKDSISVN